MSSRLRAGEMPKQPDWDAFKGRVLMSCFWGKTRRLTGAVPLSASFALLALSLSGCVAPSGPPGAMPGPTPPGLASPSSHLVQPVSPSRIATQGAEPAHSFSTSTEDNNSSLSRSDDSPLPVRPPMPEKRPENLLPDSDAEKPGLTTPAPQGTASATEPLAHKTEPGKVTPEKFPSGKGPMVSMDLLEEEGRTIRLASAILTAGANPFLNRLPKPPAEPSSPANEPAISVPPPVDPFNSISLAGILYNAKSPMALVAVADGGAAGETGNNSSQIVGVGSVLPASGGTLRVTGIQRDRVEFQRVDGNKRERRTLSLPSIVGFEPHGNGERDEESTSPNAAASTPPAENRQNAPPTTKPSPDLSNLTRLMETAPPSNRQPSP